MTFGRLKSSVWNRTVRGPVRSVPGASVQSSVQAVFTRSDSSVNGGCGRRGSSDLDHLTDP